MKKPLITLLCLLISPVSHAHGLLPETLIKTPAGHVPIEQLKVGDEVWACDFDNEKCQPERVEQISTVEAEGYVEVLINGEILGMSESHRVWSWSQNRWLNASIVATRKANGCYKRRSRYTLGMGKRI